MKNIIRLTALLPVMLLFYGCPVGTDYPLGNPGKEAIDKTLIGTWTTEGDDPDFKKVVIKKKDNYTYDIEVFETGTMYSLDVTAFTAWVTQVGDRAFIEALPLGSSDTKYYLYCYQSADKQTMKSYDATLLVGGMDAVTSTDAYREEVKASMGKEGFLAEETVWKKE